MVMRPFATVDEALQGEYGGSQLPWIGFSRKWNDVEMGVGVGKITVLYIHVFRMCNKVSV